MNNNIKKMDRKKQLSVEFFTGVFFLVAVSILIYFTALVNGKDLLIDKESYMLEVNFESIGMLQPGDKVFVLGMKLGVVEKVIINDDYSVINVILDLERDVPLYEGYDILIKNSSVFGGNIVYIKPGLPTGAIQPRDTVFNGRAPIDLMNEAAELVARLREDEKKISKLFEDGGAIDDISDAAENMKDGAGWFSELMNEASNGTGTVAKLIKDPALYNDAVALVSDVKDIMHKVKLGEGSIGKLMNSDEAYTNLVGTLTNLNQTTSKLAAGEGTLGMILNDSGKLYGSVDDTFTSITQVADSINDSKGTLGMVVNDGGKLYQSLDTSFSAIADVAVDIKRSKGTLGLLIRDDSLYKEAKATVEQVKAAVEDFREQAPVATFGSMLFGAL